MTDSTDVEFSSADYETALNVVQQRTNPDVCPVISQFDLVGKLGQAGIDTMVAGDLVDNLVATKHLLRWEYDGRYWLCLDEPAAIQRAIVYEAEERDEPEQKVIARLNQELMQHENSE